MAGITRAATGVSSTKAVVVLSIPDTSRIRSSTSRQVRVRGSDDSTEEIARSGRAVDLHHLRDRAEMVGHVVSPALGDLEGDEGRDGVTDPRQIDLGTEAGDHSLSDELVEPRLDRVAGHLELAGELHGAGPRRGGERLQQASV